MKPIMEKTSMQGKQSTEPLTFGFDIGIASVGWAVLSPTRIVDLGVRAFDKAETAKEGSRSISHSPHSGALCAVACVAVHGVSPSWHDYSNGKG